MPVVRELARAKVNLTLTVRGRRSDGYHALVSLVTFAAGGDVVSVEPDAEDRLSVSGPFAHAIDGENLLARTAALLRDADARLRIGAVHLEKVLPVAAGLGGGSADAAALLRAVRHANPGRAADLPWLEMAARLGADVPVCLVDRPALIWGRGERMASLPSLPALHAVLVNPRLPLATGGVFAALRAAPAPPDADVLAPPRFPDRAALLDYLRARGNDLESPAIGLLPPVADVKALLAAQVGCCFAAMSGSGATCFGLFAAEADARGAAAAISAARPAWWVEPTALAGAP